MISVYLLLDNQSILYSKSRSIHFLMLFSLVSSETISEGYFRAPDVGISMTPCIARVRVRC